MAGHHEAFAPTTTLGEMTNGGNTSGKLGDWQPLPAGTLSSFVRLVCKQHTINLHTKLDSKQGLSLQQHTHRIMGLTEVKLSSRLRLWLGSSYWGSLV